MFTIGTTRALVTAIMTTQNKNLNDVVVGDKLELVRFDFAGNKSATWFVTVNKITAKRIMIDEKGMNYKYIDKGTGEVFPRYMSSTVKVN